MTFSVLCLLASPALSLEPEADAVFVRVVDCGPALCCVVKLPGNHYMIYDAGHWQNPGKTAAINAIRELIPHQSTVDLLVLSHSDSDHLGAVPTICAEYKVKRVLRTGYKRPSIATWVNADTAIANEVTTDGCEDVSLATNAFPRDGTFRIGDAFVQFVAGWQQPLAEWGFNASDSEHRNAVSIVVKLTYKGRSVLFGGDTVGREIGGPIDQCVAAEKNMLEWNEAIPLKADVLIAPHHGADNGSSSRFIHAVSPKYVIFSAGHNFGHPRKATANRYLANGVLLERMFRTDLGDDESSQPEEWKHGTLGNGHSDPVGDDDVDILIRKTEEL